MEEYRCRRCARLLFKGYLGVASNVEIKCRDCHAMNAWAITGEPADVELIPDGLGGYVPVTPNPTPLSLTSAEGGA